MLDLGFVDSDFIKNSLKSGIKGEYLDANTIRTRWPALNITDNHAGFYSYNAGVVMVVTALEVLRE